MPGTNMNISVNGESKVPPGFRFHPTEEELLQYYLRKKVSYEEIDLDVIKDVDLNKLEPWDIQETCKIGSTPQNDSYFFSHKDKKYPTSTRTNRATAAGFWKATGRDKIISTNSRRIGMRKTLVFYKGRAPNGQKSDWIMHEYRLDDNNIIHVNNEEGWVVCRIFKKKNHYKTLDRPSSKISTAETITQRLMMSSRNEGTLEQILQHIGRTCKEEDESNDGVTRLPSLESPNSSTSQPCYQTLHEQMLNDAHSNWAAIDGLLAGFNDSTVGFGSISDHDLQLRQFQLQSLLTSNDPLGHMSNSPS